MTPDRWHALKSLFGQALALAPDEQSRFVRQACGGDSDLANCLHSLVAHHETANSLLEGPLISQGRVVEYLSAGLRTFQPDEVIGGRFRIERFIAEGGMGEVYAAVDLDLGERVAVKTLRPTLSSDQELLRLFKTEIQIARKVTHENVARVFDLFWHEIVNGGVRRSVAFVTMELLEGETLAQRILRLGPMREADALAIAVQVSEGLSKAHSAGIIHRDFKSGNILLVDEPAKRIRAVVTDFGLARMQSNNIQVAGTAARIEGTPAYIAPEQLTGGAITPAVDIYALGVVLFEMVTARLPFTGSTPQEVAERRLWEAPPSPRAFVSRLDRRWEAAVLACLQKDPALRPATPRAVIARIRSRKEAARRFAALAVAAALLTGGIWVLGRPKPLSPEAVKNVKRGEEFARQRNEQGLQNAVLEFQRATRLEPNYAGAWIGLAEAYSAMANFGIMDHKEAMKNARQAAEKAVATGPHLAKALGVLGYVTSLDVHEWLTAGDYLRRAVEADPADPTIRLWYGAYLGKLGESSQAFENLNTGLNQDPSSFILNQQLAIQYSRARQFSRFYDQARELVRLKPYESASYVALARALEWIQKYDEALQSCYDIAKYGDPETALCMRGTVEAARGNLEPARAIATQVKEYWKSKPFETNLVASLYCRLGERATAIDLLNEGFDRGDSTVLNAPTNPYFDPLRGEPAYEKFLARIGWPSSRK